MADRVGQQLGNYRLIRLLGRGGFAEVYLGEHLRLKTQVAVKILHTSLEDNDIEGFLREAQTVARLKHPHIVRVFDFDVENHTPYLVMDYLPNGNVRRSYPKGTSLPLETIVFYAKQVASALQYAHDQKLIHRDVKPENMLLDQDNTIVLGDFGIALMAQSSRYQSTQEVAGTAAYMAPEQFQGHPHRASDQYALGVVVYEWLTGDRPFHGSFTEIYSQQLFVPPSSLCEKVPDLPSAVEQVVLTALAKDPKERFANIKAFATALEHACQAVPPRPIALPSELPSPSQPLPPTDTVAAFPSGQLSRPLKTETSSPPPTKALSATPLAESFSASNLPNYESTTPVPETRRDAAIAHRRQGLPRSRMVLLIGLALLVLIGSLGLFNIIRTNQIATGNADVTATVRTNATDAAHAVATLVQAKYATATTQAQVAATVTATIASNNYVQATSGTPVLNDAQIGCDFTGGVYHVGINQKNTFLVCYSQPTFSNFAFQAQMTILKGDYGGIVFRTNKQDPFGYRFAVGVGGWCNLVYGNKELAKCAAIKVSLNQPYLLTAIARGSSISLYIDKQWVTTVEDSSANSGNVALMAGDFSNEADIAYRHVQVWNL